MAADSEILLRYIRRLVGRPGQDGTSDDALLGRFISAKDEEAFAALVDRHGPLVLQVCRRVLGDVEDAEDAFQAAFMVLARKAGTVHREALAAWLHGVAYRVALKSRSARVRQFREAQPLTEHAAAPQLDPLAQLSARELLALIDEEVRRLPQVYRLPVILCCLEGRSQEEAARQLGWTPGSVKGRLERGRARLHDQLIRRGLTLSAALAAAEMSRGAASAVEVARLASATVRGATAFALRPTTAASGVSAEAAALAEDLLRNMTLAKLKLGALLLLTFGIVTAAAGIGAQHGLLAKVADEESAKPAKTIADSADQRQKERPVQVRTDAYGDPLPKGAIARVGTARLRHGSQVYCLAFSPDGRFIASGSFHGDLCLWDRATGKLLRRFVEPPQDDRIRFVTAIAFSPDGEILASNKGKAGLWETRSGKLLRHLDKTFSICSLAFSPDGKSLASGTSDEKGIWIFDPATGKACRPIAGHTGPVTAVGFSKDGKMLASGSADKTARIWDFVTGKELHRFEPQVDRLDRQERVMDVALASDNKLLAVQTTKQVSLWEVTTGREVHRFPAERQFWSLAFSPDGTRLASANLIWDVKTGREICRLEGLPSSGTAFDPQGKTLVPVTGSMGGIVTGALAFAPDGKTLVTGGYDGVVRLHDPTTGKELPQASQSPWNRGIMMICGFAPDGRWLAVRDNGGIHLCETASGKEIHRLPMGDDYGVSLACLLPVALSLDGRMAVAAGAKAIYRWDTITGKELGRTPNPRKWDDLGPFAALAFAPDGKTFACAHYEPTIRFWDAATAKELSQFQGHESGIRQLFFSPDGKRLVSESGNQTIQFWDVATRQELRRWSVPAGWIQAFSPDGKTIAAGGKTGREGENPALVLYDLVSGKELRRFDEIVPTYCAFSADGRLLAVDADPSYYPDQARTIQLLEVASGKVREQFTGHFGFPGQMVFSSDGRMLATGGSDTTALIWDVTGRMSEGRLQAEQLSADQLKILWGELTSDDAKLAHRAIWTLAAAPAQAVPLLKEKLPPIPRDILPRINRMIQGLDSNQFAVREKAAAELEELGDIAEPALRKTLAGDPSQEVRRRIEPVLDKLNFSRSRLQKLRAVEVLEHIASPEAREVLEVLARGAPEARLTQEAKASLERLTKWPVASP